MNYIKELNAFKNWLLLNELPTSAIVLWHTLMTINNATHWKREFNAPNSVVRQLSGLSKQGLLNARGHLIDHERIHCKKGKRGQAPIYEMVPFGGEMDPFMAPSMSQTTPRSTKEATPEAPTRSWPIQKQKKKQDSSRMRAAGDPVSLYEKNIGKLSPITADLLKAWSIERGEALVTAAIELAVKRNARTFRYVESILKEWASKDIMTIDEMQAFEQEKRSHTSNRVSISERRDYVENMAFFEALRQEGVLS